MNTVSSFVPFTLLTLLPFTIAAKLEGADDALR